MNSGPLSKREKRTRAVHDVVALAVIAAVVLGLAGGAMLLIVHYL